MNAHADLLRRLAHQTSTNAGLVTVTRWQLERTADELDRLANRCAELEAVHAEPSLFDQ